MPWRVYLNYDSSDKKYCYPGTDVLVNKFGIKDQELLKTCEQELTRFNLVKLEERPLKGNFDLKHLQRIHNAIFKDIYPFAGQLRTVDISKGYFTFASYPYIKNEADKLFKHLKNEKLLIGIDIDEFSKRAAHYMAEINVLHPFREGNGRTQREFIRSLALNSGFKLNWYSVNKDSLLKASIVSVYDTKELADIIKDSIENKEPIRKLIRSLSPERSLER